MQSFIKRSFGTDQLNVEKTIAIASGKLKAVLSEEAIKKIKASQQYVQQIVAAKKSSGSKPAKIAETKKTTLYMFRSGKSIEEIAAERKFAISTIEGHLCEFILTGDVSVNQFVSPEK